MRGPTTPASAAEVVQRLTALRHAGELTQQIPAVIEPEVLAPRRSRLPIAIGAAVAVLLVGYVGAVALTGGSGSGVPFPDLLHHNNPTTTAAAKTSTPASPSPSAAAVLGPAGPAYALSSATSFDPPPGDGSEEQSQTHNAIDADPATVWNTERYYQANFGGLKPGVGLLVDAGSAVAPQQVEVLFTTAGARFEIRAADAPATAVAGFALEAPATTATKPDASVAIADRTPHRYWLLWLTYLPPPPDGFRASVATFSLRH